MVENPGFWNWTFTLKGIDGEVLAQIDRDWRGFGFEVLLLLRVILHLFFRMNRPIFTAIKSLALTEIFLSQLANV